jgi:hypothetical protein
MKANKILHRNEQRIKLSFPYHQETVVKLRQIKGLSWSKTHNSWHIPYTKEAFAQLKSLFPDVEYEKALTKPEVLPAVAEEKDSSNTEGNQRIPASNKADITITVSGKKIAIKMPKNETDIAFVRTFNYVRWDKTEFCWIVPNYGKNLEIIQNYFNERIATLEHKTEEVPRTASNIAHPPFAGVLPELEAPDQAELSRFKGWMEHKRYSDSTIKTYLQALSIFLRFVKPKTSIEVTNEDMVCTTILNTSKIKFFLPESGGECGPFVF